MEFKKVNRYLPQVIFVSIFVAFVIPRQSWAVDCASADIELTSQEAVNNFQADYGNGGTCDTVTGSLTVRGSDSQWPSGDITNISGLLGITSIGGDLHIRTNELLTNLDGLTNLTSVLGVLDFSRNSSLINTDGLSKLHGALNELWVYQNGQLPDLDGLINLTEVPKIYIQDNSKLANIDGLRNLNGVVKNIYIEENTSLVNVDGLAGINGVEWQLRVVANSSLANIDGLAGLINIESLSLWNNDSLTNLDGLENLTNAGGLTLERNSHLASVTGLKNLTNLGGLRITRNQLLTDIDGLENLTSIGWLEIDDNDSLANIDGLRNLAEVDGSLRLTYNDALTDLDALFKLAYVKSTLYILGNESLLDVSGLSNLTTVGTRATIRLNNSLTNLDGLSALVHVGDTLTVTENESLAQCQGLFRLLDQWDDAEPGPGPGISSVGTDGIPDVGSTVIMGENLSGCNSIEEIFADTNPSRINAGLNDAWYNPETSGQGFFISVFPDLAVASLAWFTYDTELPPDDVQANLGDPGHRWLTAVGPIEGNQAFLDIEMTSGGLFDTATEIQRTDPPGSDGTIILTFDSCNSGTVEYDIPSINRHGIVPIQRVADDNIALCEALNAN